MAAVTLSSEQAAALIGVSTRRLFQLAKEENPPPKDSIGRYPPDSYGKWVRERIISELGVSQNGESYDLQAEKGRLTFHQANIAALEEEIKRKNVIPADVVQWHWENMVSNARAKLLNLPSRVAPIAMSASTIQEIEQMVRDLIHEALTEMAGNGIP